MRIVFKNVDHLSYSDQMDYFEIIQKRSLVVVRTLQTLFMLLVFGLPQKMRYSVIPVGILLWYFLNIRIPYAEKRKKKVKKS